MQRIVYATVPHYNRIKAVFGQVNGGVESILCSFYYLNMASPERVDRTLKLISNYCKSFFLDSGVFTLKIRTGVFNLHMKYEDLSHGEKADVISASKLKKDEMTLFFKRYASFLKKYDKYITWAFELDVDQFLGIEVADKLYEFLIENVPHPEKIIRIWHSTRTFQDWVDWCKSGRYKYLAVEGGSSHSRDPDFYRRFVDVAHEHGIKVHVLAITDVKFLEKVAVDSADSSTWSAGGRYAYIYTPHGKIGFGYGHRHTKKHWGAISDSSKKEILAWINSAGIKTKITDEALQKTWQAREIANLIYFKAKDEAIKLKDVEKTVKRQSFL